MHDTEGDIMGIQSKSVNLTRRDMVRGAAVLGGAAAAAAVPAAMASEADSAPDGAWEPAWTDECDILAIGAGSAGLSAAITGRDLGLDVIVLESQESYGGNSIRCNGGMLIPGSPLQQEQGIEDSAEIMAEDLLEYCGTDCDEAYIRLLSQEQAKLWDYLTGLGIEFKQEGLIATTGQSRAREHHVSPYDAVTTLYDAAVERGADIRLSTPATHLVQNPATKEVVGALATDADGDQLAIKAKKGVILCAGGYARSVDMLNKYIFGAGVEDYMDACMDAPGQDGSGISMAMEIGAETRHISYINMLTAHNPDGNVTDACSIFHVGAVLVNEQGERFVNEAQGYIGVWTEVNAQTDKVCFQVWDQPIYDAYKDNESSYYSMQKLEDSGLLLKADTLEELAGLMGVPADAFVATMDKYNGDIESEGYDTVFGRKTLVSMAGEPVQLVTPPFYGWKTTNSLCCTKGGIRQDAEQECQAVTVMGDVIGRLHLAGNISGYCNFGIKPGTREAVNSSGTGFGGAIAMGRYCAQRIAEHEDWDA